MSDNASEAALPKFFYEVVFHLNWKLCPERCPDLQSLVTSLLLQHSLQRCQGLAVMLPNVSAASVTSAAAVTDKQNLALTHIKCAQGLSCDVCCLFQGESNAGHASLPKLHHDRQSTGYENNEKCCVPPWGSRKPLELSAWSSHHEAFNSASVKSASACVLQCSTCSKATCVFVLHM